MKQRVGPKIACVRCGAPVRRVSGRPFLSTEYCAYPQCQRQGEQLQQLLEQQQQRQEQQRRELAQLQQRQAEHGTQTRNFFLYIYWLVGYFKFRALLITREFNF